MDVRSVAGRNSVGSSTGVLAPLGKWRDALEGSAVAREPRESHDGGTVVQEEIRFDDRSAKNEE